MDEPLENESASLKQAWDQHAANDLKHYMIADVEEPRLNVQSILSRHFLIRDLVGERLDEVCEHELRFACAMNWLLRQLKRGISWQWLDQQLGDLLVQDVDDDDSQLPRHLRQTASLLPCRNSPRTVPDYVVDGMMLSDDELSAGQVPERLLQTFERLFQQALAQVQVEAPPVVLEPACGSANDYRFLDSFGIARHIDYRGFDIAEANIANARHMFPGARARFSVGNVFDIDAGDDACDLLFTHDLFEHLSPAGIERAADEFCRVTRRAMMLHFFNLEDRPEHLIRPVAEYHWNLLSLPRIRQLFESRGGSVEAIHIPTMLAERFDYHQSHNREAWTLTVRF